jgi:hypothetical protein
VPSRPWRQRRATTPSKSRWKTRSFSAAGAVALVVIGAVVTPVGQKVVDRLFPSGDGTTSAGASTPRKSDAGKPSGTPEVASTVNALTEMAAGASPSPATAGGPLLVSATHVAVDRCDGAPGWRVPVPADQLGPPPADDVYDWFRSHGGSEVSGTHITLTLQGRIDDPVTITDIRATVLDKKAPSPGTYVIPYGECGGGDEKHYLLAKLDDTPPQVYRAVPNFSDQGVAVLQANDRPFATQTFTVSKSDTETFEVYARAEHGDYDWQLAIHWISASTGPRVTTIRNEDGKPFLTVPRPSGQPLTNGPDDQGNRKWQPISPGMD